MTDPILQPTRAPNAPSATFSLNVNSPNMPQAWKNFAMAFKIYMTANNLDNEPDTRKVAILLNTIGTDALQIFYSFDIDMANITCEDLILRFETYFLPKVNISIERHKLFNRKQGPHEDIESYATDLKNISLQCNLGSMCDDLLKDIFSWNLNSSCAYIKEKILLERPKTFEETVSLAKVIRNTKIDAKCISNEQVEEQVNAVQKRQFKQGPTIHPPVSKSNSRLQENRNLNEVCPKCGQVHRVRCPAFGVTCKKCGRKNHFAVVCYAQPKRINMTSELDHNSPTHSDSHYLSSLFLSAIHKDDNDYLTHLSINKQDTRFLLDTGADTNILSLKTYKKLQLPLSDIIKSSHKLSTFSGEILPTVGQCQVNILHNDKNFLLNFHILDRNCQNIIGRKSCEDLKLVKRVHNVQFKDTSNKDLLAEYSHLFTGIGCLKDFNCHLTLKPDATPSVDACRRVPFALLDDLKKELEILEENNIIIKVEEPTDWVSSIVLTSKKNGKIRLCIDPRKLNESLMRAHYQFPTIDEIKTSLSGAQYFSTLDANKGFYMLKLDHSSSKLCTFITPLGRYRFLRLPFGINAAPEIFHAEMTKRFSDLEGVKVMMDDLLIYGSTKQEHNDRLERVLQRALEIGIKFNKEKSNISQHEVKYLGHIFSKDGVKVDPTKVQAINQMPPPTNLTELQRFMGMVNYLGSYIQNLSQKTVNLRSLLSKNTEWHWSDKHDNEFNELKHLITNAPVLTYYNQNRDIVLSVDSSKDAMGAVICHDKQPIAYASASLSQAQQAYSQIEKELLAILFGCTKFHQYIYGRNATVETDHKPIVSLFKKPIFSIPARLQRIMLRLQPYDINIVYKPGKYLYVADTLSRCALAENALTDLEDDIDLQVNLVINSLSISPHKMKEFQDHTAKDQDLVAIMKLCKTGWPEHKKSVPANIRFYFSIKNELQVINDLLLKNDRIVVPNSLRNDILKLLHEGHQGIKSCQNLAKNSVYWPNIYTDIETYISSCHICLTHRRNNTKEPICHHDIKLIPWHKVGVDLFDFDSLKYLLVVDYFSKFVEIAHLNNNSTASNVIRHLKSIFSRHGIPYSLQSDNGPPFSSNEFAAFTAQWQIEHITSSPYHSRSNGMVEKAIGTIKNIFKKCLVDKTDPYLAILQYRNTPKYGLCSPAQLLMSRTLRSKLPILSESLVPKVPSYKEVEKKMKEQRQYSSLYYNTHSRGLPPLNKGDKVYFKTQPHCSWTPGIISDVCPNRSYTIDNDAGSTFRRNRIHIMKPKTMPCSPVHPSRNVPSTINTPIPGHLENKTNINDTDITQTENSQNILQENVKYSSFGRAIRKPLRYSE